MAKGLVLFAVLGIHSIALAQTSADLSAKYPQVISYKVRPNVLMTAKFAADGQACEMTVEKREKTDAGIIFEESFSENEVRSIMDELVPENERGRNLTRALNETVAGGFATTEYTYENTLVRVYGITRPQGAAGDRVITITWPKRPCSGGQSSAGVETAKPNNKNLQLTARVVASGNQKLGE